MRTIYSILGYKNKLRILHYLCLCLLFACLFCPSAFGQVSKKKEYNIKAGFLFNFGRFVQWPDSTFANKKSAFVFCVYGDNPFGNIIDEFKTRRIANRKVDTRTINTLSDLSACNIAFLDKSKAEDFAEIQRAFAKTSILTVTEQEGAGMINMFTDANKVRFEIYLDRAKEAQLNISSKLLRLAVKVHQ